MNYTVLVLGESCTVRAVMSILAPCNGVAEVRRRGVEKAWTKK